MSVDAKIKEALSEFGDPVENAVYHSSSARYYVFDYTTHGMVFADDTPGMELFLVQIHLFAPLNENIASRRKRTQKALFDAGFTWPETIDASDEESRHIVFECQIAEGVD